MMSLARPTAHADFVAESQAYLLALQTIAAGGTPIGGKHFEPRKLWSVAKHKAALVGASTILTKCAWCEQHCEWRRQLDVEHYRPKAAVTRWEGSPPLVSDVPPDQVPVSGGYWWLAFDWNNYSLACGPCNQGWKRNLFPVRGPRAPYREDMEAHEAALLVDPMSSFRTADHFSWDKLGIMNAASDRGEAESHHYLRLESKPPRSVAGKDSAKRPSGDRQAVARATQPRHIPKAPPSTAGTVCSGVAVRWDEPMVGRADKREDLGRSRGSHHVSASR
jgi:hypothetical protein